MSCSLRNHLLLLESDMLQMHGCISDMCVQNSLLYYTSKSAASSSLFHPVIYKARSELLLNLFHAIRPFSRSYDVISFDPRLRHANHYIVRYHIHRRVRAATGRYKIGPEGLFSLFYDHYSLLYIFRVVSIQRPAGLFFFVKTKAAGSELKMISYLRARGSRWKCWELFHVFLLVFLVTLNEHDVE